MRATCKFCNKDLGEIYASSDDEAPLTQGHPSSHECSECQVRYVYRRDGELYGYVIWTFYRNRKYGAHFFMNPYVGTHNGPWKDVVFKLTREGIQEIFTCDVYPDITPSNFAKKLPTLLIFS
jgi:hypothetical protein